MPAFPRYENLARWKRDLLYAVQDASAFDDNSEVTWVKSAWDPGTTLASLSSNLIPKKFKTLDQKLARALRNTVKEQAPEHLKTDMDALTEANVEMGQLCSGLQYVWCILDIFRTGYDLSTFVDTLDLWNLQYKGDAHMHDFRAK